MKRRNFLGLLVAAPVAAVAATRFPPRPPSTGLYRAFVSPEAHLDLMSEDAEPISPDLEVVEYWGNEYVTTMARNAARTMDETAYEVIRRQRNPFLANRVPWKVIG